MALSRRLALAAPLTWAARGHAEDVPSLKQAAAARGLLFGGAPETSLAAAPGAYRGLIAAHCALLAPILPWTAARRPGEYAWGEEAVAALEFAETHGMRLTGSHLLWHEWMPDWFTALTDRAAAGQAMREHITWLVTRFAGRAHAWNVVNEAIRPEDGGSGGLRATPLLARLGPEYIEAAFIAARQADPRAKLLYNDYNMEAATPAHEARRGALLRLLDRLLAKGVPIDGVGLQSHLHPDEAFDARRYRRFLEDIAARGLTVAITELDVLETRVKGTIAARDQAVADVYTRFLAAALDEPAVSAVVLWGLADPYSWQNAWRNEPSRAHFRRSDGTPARPLPFDLAFHPKPAFHAVLRALEHAPDRGPG